MPTTARLPILPDADRANIDPNLLEVVEYRKSGLSLNHVIGCPLDCAYCVRHLFGNFAMKVPRALMTDEAAVDRLVTHHYFQPGLTPIQVFNRATDPFLPVVKPHTFRVLELLDQRRLHNHVLVITRWRVDPADCAHLNSFASIRPTILVTHSGIDDPRIEPVDSRIAAASLRTLYEHADRYRVVLDEGVATASPCCWIGSESPTASSSSRGRIAGRIGHCGTPSRFPCSSTVWSLTHSKRTRPSPN